MTEPVVNDPAFGEPYDTGSEEIFRYFCEPCNFDGYHRKAVGYCVNCKDYVCVSCFDAHRKPLPLRHHVLLDEGQMPKETPPTRPKDTCSEKCHEHEGELIKLYCKTHNQFGCGTCMGLNHRTCDDVLLISELANGIENSEEYRDLKRKMYDFEQQYKEIQRGINFNAEKLKTNYTHVLDCIAQFRADITNCLDKLQQAVETEVKTHYDAEKKKLSSITERSNTISNILNSVSSELKTFEMSKQNSQMFMAIIKANTKTNGIGEQLTTMKKSNAVTTFAFELDSLLVDLLNNKRVFGTLVVEKLRENMTIYETNIRIATTYDSVDSDINGMVVLSEELLIIADAARKSIKLLGKTSNTSILKFASPPWDITAITPANIAVTLPEEKKIQMFKVSNTFTEDRVIKVNGCCRGIVHTKGRLVVSFDKPGKLEMIDMEGTVVWVVRSDTNGKEIFQQPWHIAVSNDNSIVYVSDHANHTLTAVARNGHIKAKYTSENLKYPRGMAVDKYGSVYVCGVVSNNIHQLNKLLSEERILLSATNGVYVPKLLACSDKDNRLYVSMNKNNFIKVLRIK